MSEGKDEGFIVRERVTTTWSARSWRGLRGVPLREDVVL